MSGDMTVGKSRTKWRARSAAIAALLLPALLCWAGCDLFLAQLADTGSLDAHNSRRQVTLDVCFLGVEENFLQAIGVDLTEIGKVVPVSGAQQLGTAAATRTSAVIPASATGGAASGSYFLPANSGPGFLPQVVALGDEGTTTVGVFPTLADTFELPSNAATVANLTGRVDDLSNFVLDAGRAGQSPEVDALYGDILNDAELKRLIDALADTLEERTQIGAPQVQVTNGQRASVMVLNQTSYLTEFEPEIAQAVQIADPVIRIIRDGIVLDLRPVISADDGSVDLTIYPGTLGAAGYLSQQSNVNGQQSSILLPILETVSVQTTVSVPAGGTVLLGGIKRLADGRVENGLPIFRRIPAIRNLFSSQAAIKETQTLLILITPRIIDEDGGE